MLHKYKTGYDVPGLLNWNEANTSWRTDDAVFGEQKVFTNLHF